MRRVTCSPFPTYKRRGRERWAAYLRIAYSSLAICWKQREQQRGVGVNLVCVYFVSCVQKVLSVAPLLCRTRGPVVYISLGILKQIDVGGVVSLLCWLWAQAVLFRFGLP